MPWTIGDVEKHNKSVKDKPTWVKIANDTRDRCIKKGGSEGMCDALAIATANKAVKNIKEVRMSEEIKEPKMEEGVEIESDIVPLEEKAISGDGTALIKIISPGWGSSGYYPADMLARDAGVYKAKTHLYWDHPTATEAEERPERSLRDLAGELVEDGKYLSNGPTGPGVYARAQVFDAYKPIVEELAPHIGTSHRATGTKKAGEAEGKKGNIIEQITSAASVDFVTQPGRGGEIIQLFEAARGKALDIKGETHEIDWGSITLDDLKRNRSDLIESLRDEIKSAVYGNKEKLEEVKRMSDGQIEKLEEEKTKLEEEKGELETKLEELGDETSRLKEVVILREARDFVSTKLGESELPDITKSRLVETLSKHPVLDDAGALDSEKYTQHIDEAIKSETEYIAKLTGTGDGKVKGMGSAQESGDGMAQLKESFKRGYLREGRSEEEADRLAGIAATGR